MAYKVDFLGLIHFLDRGRQGKLVLMPDGRHPAPLHVRPHYGNFFIKTTDIDPDRTSWTPTANKKINDQGISEFQISRPSTLTMSGLEMSGSSGCWPFGAKLDAKEQKSLPELESERKLKIVPEWADTIAQMAIPRGKLESFLFGGQAHGSGVSRLTVEHSGPITILARASDRSRFQVLTLKDTAEIVLSNTSDLVNYVEDQESHFRLYARLDLYRRDETLKTKPPVPKTLPTLNPDHPYLYYILHTLETVPNGDCSNSCC